MSQSATFVISISVSGSFNIRETTFATDCLVTGFVSSVISVIKTYPCCRAYSIYKTISFLSSMKFTANFIKSALLIVSSGCSSAFIIPILLAVSITSLYQTSSDAAYTLIPLKTTTTERENITNLLNNLIMHLIFLYL